MKMARPPATMKMARPPATMKMARPPATTVADILELASVTAGYGRTVILEDVSVTLRQGTALAVLGRNGVGKSTLMRTIAGHTTLHDGHIVLEGASVGAMAPWQRARLGVAFVPQEREIFPSLSV